MSKQADLDSELASAAAEQPESQAGSVRILATAILRTALLPTVAVVVAGVVLAVLLVGSPGLWGALIGGAIALASSLLTVLMMKQSADLPVQVVMAIAMGGYVFKILALMIVAVLLKDVAWLHRLSLALTLLAAVLVWAGAEIVAFRRTKIPTLIV